MRIFLEEMVLNFPSVIKAETVGQLHLFERLMKKITLVAFLPRARQLEFVENAETHGSIPKIFDRTDTSFLARVPAAAVRLYSRGLCQD